MYVWFYETGKRAFKPEKYQAKIADINEKYDHKKENADGNVNKVNRIERKRNKKIRKVEKSIEEGNLFMRWGEPLAILDSQAIKKTTTQLRLFLESKGYFRSETDYQVTFSNKKARVNYNIVENRPYIIDSLVLRSNNQRITALINAFQEESLLQEGENYDQENLTNETNRIENLLKDNGYFDFGKRFIDFEVDTAYGDHKVAIRTVISEASEGTHRIFKIDSVLFTLPPAFSFL